jgi:hypothetical protein
MSKPLEASPSVSDAKFLHATATLAVSALRALLFALPLATTLLLSACVSSGLELAAVATADPASGDAGSGSIAAQGDGHVPNISYLERLKSGGGQVSRAERKPADESIATTTLGSLAPEN